jgi:transcriptional regulator with XRE-family HTH domain
MEQIPITKILANNIKNRRAQLGLTQEQLSERMDVSWLSIALIETQKRWVSPEMLEKIAAALRCSEKDLFDRDSL